MGKDIKRDSTARKNFTSKTQKCYKIGIVPVAYLKKEKRL
jgi:hypothetical protein